MMMCSLKTKIIRGSQKDLVMAMILIMLLYAQVVLGDPVSLDQHRVTEDASYKQPIRKVGFACDECFSEEMCVVGDKSIPDDYLNNLEKGKCTGDHSVNYCFFLESKYKRSFFTAKERSGYCLHGCSFLKVNCVTDPKTPSKRWSDVETYLEKILDNTEEIPEIVDNLHEETIENWLEVLTHQWSIFLCIIPIILNQYKHYNLFGAIGFLFFFLLLNVTDCIPWDIAIHNIAVSVICIIGGAGSTVIYESMISTIIMLICLYMCFVSNIYVQLAAVVVIFIGFCFLLYGSFYLSKGRATINMFMLLVQVYLLYCQIDYLRHTFAESSLVGIMIEMCLNAIAPNGAKRFWYMNAAVLGINFVNKIQTHYSKPLIFLFVYFVQMISFLGFRAFFGAFCLYVLRYKFNFSSIACGLYVYASDFFGGFRCVLRILFNFERLNGKRICYAAGSLFLLYREIMYAREFAFIRLVISAFDAAFIQSSYYRASHYLDLNVNFMKKEFPQHGSLPWFDMSKLELLSKYTSIIKVGTINGYRRGVGCVLKFKNSKPVLVTVEHVLGRAQNLLFNDKVMEVRRPRFIGGRDDPIVTIEALGDDFKDAPVVDTLLPSEIDYIETLVFINCNEREGNAICFVPDFKFHGGQLYAAVDLDYGDSGGPCFAVLAGGSVRYCGAVSKGNGNSGGGNIISLIYRRPGIDHDSSDDETEIERNRVQQYDVDHSVTIRPSTSDDPTQHHANGVEAGAANEVVDPQDEEPNSSDSMRVRTGKAAAALSLEGSLSTVSSDTGLRKRRSRRSRGRNLNKETKDTGADPDDGHTHNVKVDDDHITSAKHEESDADALTSGTGLDDVPKPDAEVRGTSLRSKRIRFADLPNKIKDAEFTDTESGFCKIEDTETVGTGSILKNRQAAGTVEMEDRTDRAIKISNLRKLSKRNLARRHGKVGNLIAFLEDDVNVPIVESFSNRLIWTKPMDFKKIDDLTWSDMDTYVEELVSINPSVSDEFLETIEDLDQFRNSNPGNTSVFPDDEEEWNTKSKKKRRKDAKSRYKDRAFRKRAIAFGMELRDHVKGGAFDGSDAETAFDHIVSGHSIDTARNDAFVVPGGRYSWHYINLHDINEKKVDIVELGFLSNAVRHN